MIPPGLSFQISAPLRAGAGWIALDIQLRQQETPAPAGAAEPRASTLAHKRSSSVAFEPAAKAQRDLLGNWAYRALVSAWSTRPASAITMDYTAAQRATMDGGAGRSAWHLAYVVAVLHGLFAVTEKRFSGTARLWAAGEIAGERFVEMAPGELQDSARAIAATGSATHYLVVYLTDAAWAAQRAFFTALPGVRPLRFRDLETLRSLLELDRFDAWDNDRQAAGAPPPLPAPPAPSLPRNQGRAKAWLLVASGALATGVAAVLLVTRPEAPSAPAPPPPVAPATVAAVVVDAGPQTAPEPAPIEAEPPREARAPLKPWPKRDAGALPPEPAARKERDAGATPTEVAERQAKTNLGASLDTAERRRVPSTAE